MAHQPDDPSIDPIKIHDSTPDDLDQEGEQESSLEVVDASFDPNAQSIENEAKALGRKLRNHAGARDIKTNNTDRVQTITPE